ncbi:hypothetical protein QQ045_027680 [Rhodiola kirilowii]
MCAMIRILAWVVLTASVTGLASAVMDHEFPNCNCDDEGLLSISNILECQKVSDFLIAVAYFSIPIELLYFLSCSNIPFKWVLLQFIAFIVLCGITHLLNAWTYYGPHSFQLMLSLTTAKFLTALVSCATAITLLTLIPLVLKLKVRELFLRQNVMELDQEVGMMKKQKEASWHVRMLTQEIRKSLDKHTILYTTLVELSKTLDLHNCAVWMPNASRTEMNLTHELKRSSSRSSHLGIPVNDPDVIDIKNRKSVKILRMNSALAMASSGEPGEAGAVAAIRMPMLQVSNFKGGTPVLIDTCYAILVLVLPSTESRTWTSEELEIVEVVADQVAVALSHAAVLEESQLMRKKLVEQNRALQQAQKSALMASQARIAFQKVMSHGMRRPMHSVLGLLSMFEDENLSPEQKTIVDTMLKTGSVLSTLINDVMEISEKESGRFPLEMRSFQLHATLKEAACLSKCLCIYKNFGYSLDVQNHLPNYVLGDEVRTFQVILHMVGYLLSIYDKGGLMIFRVSSESGSPGNNDNAFGSYKRSSFDEYVRLKFEIEITGESSGASNSCSALQLARGKFNSSETKQGLSFSICKKLVQMMQGDIQITSDSSGHGQRMLLILGLQIQPAMDRAMKALSNNSSELPDCFKGLKVVLADDDDINRVVTKKLLEKIGCQVTAVSSGFECLSALGHADNNFKVVIFDLHMPEMDGFDVAVRIRKFRSRNWPLIIALTASAEEYVWERCLQTGMNGVIRKPVLLQGLADELRRVIQRASEGV